ncbi:N-acetylmuramoyl-L-alanine amidase [Caldanaerobius fijiensis DSM 17918]|uniref:N-acetylmuramoyl-L-alanine amidase n=1 Tax=Caldanaerobius fijiensis DSM 17918 TaxID=1121256 RepID=A0A1M5AFG4_9THEO|nr:N-acetylmuramoyl-L-alanine amidase [Caldanaerobius fijiensis DSM 17918]
MLIGKKRILVFALVLIMLAAGYMLYINNRVSQIKDIPDTIGYAQSRGYSDMGDVWLLARLVNGEARGEPYVGKVAVAAVVLNRVMNPSFPKSIPGVIYQPGAFESVSNGQIWTNLSTESLMAAQDAMAGWDPTGGALFFWNPSKPVNPWMWTRIITTQIGNHVFAR